MSIITIIGAGQSGLQLAIGLLDNGYDVTVVSDRTPDQIAGGRVTSSQCMFGSALAREAALGLDFWKTECPNVEGIGFAVPGPESQPAFSWQSRLDLPAQSVDQRVKMPRFIDEFITRGGNFVLESADIAALERHCLRSDLVIVAAGKGEIARLFTRDDQRSTFTAPARALALTYVTGMTPREPFTSVAFNLIPGIGEYFVFPALTVTGPCEIMVMEGVPGGPMDCWSDVTSPSEHLDRAKWVVDTFTPWESARTRAAELTDSNGVLAGRFAPTIRHPVATLPSGAAVLGMGDVVVLNDPITGQGSNNASKCAASYLASILEHGEAPFDAAFMSETFERYWDYAKYVVGWTNALLAPPPEHVLALLGSAAGDRRIARRFANDFDDPRDFFNWFMDPQLAAAEYLQPVAS
ncbi:hypothetical protein GCM10027169_06270 [Gordonia jinhuaensis]|uniref:Styrene monooxygenase StyA putative substrate binding domain-containing protein n=1 Tax=Gordonia jinhuaensis TaxID=1517702 RepID=A0A916WQP3_9ACTN|nr:styrene monooxygenase/indole monooxygenase family protein [Gordonia jinhuaensis]GGB20590.1 hypothetical protein GCM10011489_05880 [Gordonia jinhuaensis]